MENGFQASFYFTAHKSKRWWWGGIIAQTSLINKLVFKMFGSDLVLSTERGFMVFLPKTFWHVAVGDAQV